MAIKPSDITLSFVSENKAGEVTRQVEVNAATLTAVVVIEQPLREELQQIVNFGVMYGGTQRNISIILGAEATGFSDSELRYLATKHGITANVYQQDASGYPQRLYSKDKVSQIKGKGPRSRWGESK